MIVTRIERQRRQRNRVNLFLDGEFAFGLHDDIVAKARIRVGDELDPATIGILKSTEETKLARDNALRLLATRMRSEKELRFTLLEHEFDPTVVDNVLLELQTKGYIDDRKFAAAFIRDARLRKPAGTAMLFQKLRLKGIDRALIMEALDDLLPADTEQELAYTSAMKLLKRIRSSRKPVPPEKEKQRLSQYLAQRGFPWSTIRPALRKVFATNIESSPTDVEAS